MHKPGKRTETNKVNGKDLSRRMDTGKEGENQLGNHERVHGRTEAVEFRKVHGTWSVFARDEKTVL